MSTTTPHAQEAEPNAGIPAMFVDEADAVADSLCGLEYNCTTSILRFLRHLDLNSFALFSRRSGEDHLSSLEDDCTFSILSFLHHRDLNSFALCSRRCREARSCSSLDQTRTGVVVCSSSLESEIACVRQLYKAFDVGRWNNDLYSGNRTHLRVVGFFSGKNDVNSDVELGEAKPVVRSYARGNKNVQLTGVTNLDLSCSPQDVSNQFPCEFVLYALALILPNLQELDLSYQLRAGDAIGIFSTECRSLTRLTVKGSPYGLYASGFQFQHYLANLTDLNLDGSRLRMESGHHEAEYESAEEPRNRFMWMHCRKLQRLSMKNVFRKIGRGSKPISQAMIIKLVRKHPTLQWIRSDLMQENIAMLQQERPHITFVVE